MRRASLAIVLATLAAATAVKPMASDGRPSSARDWTAGAGSGPLFVVAGETAFRYIARTGGDGPTGRVSASGDPDGPGPLEPFTVSGEVTCLRIDGNRASFKWRFARATGSAAALQGGGVQSFVEDNGRPRAGAPVDRVTIDALQPQALFDLGAGHCLDPDLMEARYQRVTSGDVRVRDAG